MKKGKIVEIGNHNSLLKEYPTGTYAQLVKQQEAVENDGQDTEPCSDQDIEEHITSKLGVPLQNLPTASTFS